MKLIKKRLSLKAFTTILLALAFLFSCTEKPLQNGNSNGSATDNTDFVSYCAKEKTSKNQIYFNYPQFKETVVNAEELNDIIEASVVSFLQGLLREDFMGSLKQMPEDWIWDNNNYTLWAMRVDYRIVRYDNDYVSVVFEGLCNNREDMRPIHFFSSITINLEKCELVVLSDLYRIDMDFAEMVQKEFKEQIRAGLAEKTGASIDDIDERVEEAFPWVDSESLLKILQQTKTSGSEHGFYFFLTDTSLGISIPLNYVLGSHYEILIPYDELVLFMK